jgi:hypothetical protein
MTEEPQNIWQSMCDRTLVCTLENRSDMSIRVRERVEIAHSTPVVLWL